MRVHESTFASNEDFCCCLIHAISYSRSNLVHGEPELIPVKPKQDWAQLGQLGPSPRRLTPLGLLHGRKCILVSYAFEFLHGGRLVCILHSGRFEFCMVHRDVMGVVWSFGRGLGFWWFCVNETVSGYDSSDGCVEGILDCTLIEFSIINRIVIKWGVWLGVVGVRIWVEIGCFWIVFFLNCE